MSEVYKNLRYDILGELKHYQFAKDDTIRIMSEMYKGSADLLCDTYFYYKNMNAYCRLSPTAKEVNEGYLTYIEFFVGQNYMVNFPQIYNRSHTFRIAEIPLNEIEILSKEEFVAGLKEQLQDALDKMWGE